MKSLLALAILGLTLVGCSGGSSEDPANDTKSPTASLPVKTDPNADALRSEKLKRFNAGGAPNSSINAAPGGAPSGAPANKAPSAPSAAGN